MELLIDNILEKVSDRGFSPKRFKIRRLKTISGLVHAVIVDINDEQTEMLVALSVLEDKNKYKIIK